MGAFKGGTRCYEDVGSQRAKKIIPLHHQLERRDEIFRLIEFAYHRGLRRKRGTESPKKIIEARRDFPR